MRRRRRRKRWGRKVNKTEKKRKMIVDMEGKL
jgi:hypothetical protein